MAKSTAPGTFGVWALLGPEPAMAHAIINAVAVLIIACPCALGVLSVRLDLCLQEAISSAVVSAKDPSLHVSAITRQAVG